MDGQGRNALQKLLWPALSHGLLPSVVDDDNGLSRERGKNLKKILPTARRAQTKIADMSGLSRGATGLARTLVGRADILLLYQQHVVVK